jgi:hypothetical protein
LLCTRRREAHTIPQRESPKPILIEIGDALDLAEEDARGP